MTRVKRKKLIHAGGNEDIRFSTPPDVAAYRAERLCDADTIIEIGCGTGNQTRAFSERVSNVIAIDIDPGKINRGDFAENVVVIAGDALSSDIFERVRGSVKGRPIVFLDPQRPSMQAHTAIKPDIEEFVAMYRQITEDIAIELPPLIKEIPFECEREYLSVENELNRLTIYLGSLRKCDVSAVLLPQWQRIEHSGPSPVLHQEDVTPIFILEPDRAVEHAGLIAKALPEKYTILPLGKRRVFAAELPAPLFRSYRVVAHGTREDCIDELATFELIVLHGSMSQKEQRGMLRELQKHCRGHGTAHLFLSDQWYLTTRE